ncbi:hypothetical protein Q1695_002142 [Nippostrongylus brasiliensis]|nr:hypothetical protein Q1695_002142 [Nippostrongylus brasiliensis]
MASYMHQLAMSWQNQMFTSFPLVSNYCAPLGIFGMTFFNSPTARIPEELDVAVNESICGGKSDCHSTFGSSFDINVVTKNHEARVKWAASNYGNSGKPFRMVLPPPNVTGKLHLGHALTVTVEDTICRHHRIKGGVASWIPGFDHAGIATQTVVERELWKRKGLRRDQMTREEFVDQCRTWSATNSAEIQRQLNVLGATLDWENSYYTLDEGFSSAVVEAFVRLHNDNLIYRDKRVVNWCPILQSSISDQEVVRLDLPSPTRIEVPSTSGGKRFVDVGTMFKVKYPLSDSDGFISVATTRPETMFADVAIAVHPDDSRYSQFIGKFVKHPLRPGRNIPVIADEGVQIDKGTGAVKITPFHDALDWEIASRHKEQLLALDAHALGRRCIDIYGRLTTECGELAGVDRFDARSKVVKTIDSLGLFLGTMKHEGQISLCSRTGDVIEPCLADQWFMDTAGLYSDAEKAVKDGRIKIMPATQEQKLFDWLSNKDPWCLSRQLLWGHRIPAYRSDNSPWLVARSLEEAKAYFGKDAIVIQDDDVLDTWFSSSLIPLVNAGWPGPKFDPSEPLLDVMETGWDILGFWVARMMIMTMRLSGGQVPFSNVLLHGLVRDSSGRKMSKSLGNVIDPMDVVDGISREAMIERVSKSSLTEDEIGKAVAAVNSGFPEGIARSGPDALRFALLRHDLLASDIPINIVDSSAEGLRFCNKLWNMIAYVESVNENSPTFKDVDSEHPADEWILSRLAEMLMNVDKYMSNHAPHLAFMELRNFILAYFCDAYLEMTKRALWDRDLPRIAEIRTTLHRVVQPTLVQLSVFMPFVAEHLYERVFGREPGSIYFDFVKPTFFQIHRNADLDLNMDILLSAVSVVRSIRQQLQLPTSMVFTGILHCDDVSDEFSNLSSILFDLGKLDLLQTTPLASAAPEGFMTCTIPGHSGRLSLKIEDSHRAEFVSRLQRLLKKSEERREKFQGKAEKYESIVARDRQEGKVKPHIIEKNEKKASQARGAAKGAEEEMMRLQVLLKEISA